MRDKIIFFVLLLSSVGLFASEEESLRNGVSATTVESNNRSERTSLVSIAIPDNTISFREVNSQNRANQGLRQEDLSQLRRRTIAYGAAGITTALILSGSAVWAITMLISNPES